MANSATLEKDSLQQKTQTSFVSLHIITSACHALLNTTFIAPDPKPDWFDDLNNKLEDAKAVARQWVGEKGKSGKDLSTLITSAVPGKVIDYATTYDALTQQIHAIASAHPDASGKDNQYVIEIKNLVQALESSVTKIIADVDDLQNQMKDWGVLMQNSHDALSSGAASIQSAEVDLQTDIDKMNTAIKALNSQISAENKAIAASAAAIGVGLLLLVAGIALAPETGGASLVVAGTGGIAVVGGAITWGVMQHKINEQYDEIAKDQKELKSDQRQLVALQGLASASNQAIGSTTEATSALSEFRTSWGIFQSELNGVKSKLEQAEESVMTIVQDAFTTAAANEWKLALDFATSLADVPVTVEKKTLPMSA